MMVLVHMIALKAPIENSKTVNLPNLEPPTIASGWDLRGFTHRKLECFRAFCGTSRHPEPSWNTIQPTTTTKKNMLMASPHKASSHGSIGSTRQLGQWIFATWTVVFPTWKILSPDYQIWDFNVGKSTKNSWHKETDSLPKKNAERVKGGKGGVFGGSSFKQDF